MRGSLLALLILSSSACATAGSRSREAHCAWRVCVSEVDGPTGRDFTAVNEEPVPATVAITFREVRNLRPPSGNKVEVVVPPHSKLDVAHLATVRMDRRTGASVTIAIDLGSSSNEPDGSFAYAVPFGGGEPREIVQGFGGEETHLGSMYYSLDIAMPKRTPILAAREGTVLLVQDGFTEGGTDPSLLERANLVVVAHSDGTMASYGHLSKGVPVHVGEHVAEGQLLGYSGATGFAAQPHLHFNVGNRMLGEPGRTIPIEMRDSEGRPVDLSPGAWLPPSSRRYPRRRSIS